MRTDTRGRRGRTGDPTHDEVVVRQEGLDRGRKLRLHEPPRALVGGLVLHVADVRDLRVLGQFLRQFLGGQRVEALEGENRHLAVQPRLGARRDEVPADLARAQNDALDGGVIGDGGIAHGWFPTTLQEVCGHRGGQLVPEHRLRSDDHHWAVPVHVGVRPQQVEVRRRRGRLADSQRALGAQLQPALDARRAVVGTLAFVAVGEKQDHARLLRPLGVAGTDELVGDGLGAIGEVAELGFPAHQRLGRGHRVAVLKAHARVLTQQRIEHVELTLVVGEVLEWDPRLVGDPVDHGGEALAERAATAVLPDEADGAALHEQRAEGQQFTGRPIDGTVGDGVRAALQLGTDLGMDRETLRKHQVGAGDCIHHVLADRGALIRAELLRVVGRACVGLVLDGGHLGLGEDGLKALPELLADRLGVRVGDVAAADEGLGVETARRPLLFDQVVHQRLREARIVALVVTAASVADDIDDDVLGEPLAVIEGQLRHPCHRLRVVPVDVEDRGLDHFGDVGAVEGRPRLDGCGGETDLVVDDQVDRAAGLVAAQLAHLHGFVHHTLAREGRIAVHQHRHHRVRVASAQMVVLRAGDAFHDRVDRLQVGRVRGHGGLHGLAGGGGELTLGAQVVLHVAGAHGHGEVDVAAKLAENVPIGLADDVGQHVETTAVRHADHDFVQARVGGGLAQLVQHDDRRLATFQAEALLTHELRLEEGLKDLGFVELVEDPQVFVLAPLRRIGLHAVLDPAALLRVGDVHVLDADRPTVGVAERGKDAAQRAVLAAAGAAQVAHREGAIEIPQGQAVVFQHEIRVGALAVLQRIEVSLQVAERPIGLDQVEDACLTRAVLQPRGGRVHRPAHRGVGNAQGGEDLVVEAVMPDE